VRFALSAEEAGFLIAKLPTMEPAEFVRKTAMGPNQKVFRAFPRPDGSVQLVVDYELNGQGGQEPPSEKEAVRNGVVVLSFLTCFFRQGVTSHTSCAHDHRKDRWKSASCRENIK
jgi:hypothetical protein